MSNEEQRRMLVEILSKLVDVLDCDELSLLAHHVVIPVSDFYSATEPDLFNEQQRLAA